MGFFLGFFRIASQHQGSLGYWQLGRMGWGVGRIRRMWFQNLLFSTRVTVLVMERVRKSCDHVRSPVARQQPSLPRPLFLCSASSFLPNAPLPTSSSLVLSFYLKAAPHMFMATSSFSFLFHPISYFLEILILGSLVLCLFLFPSFE